MFALMLLLSAVQDGNGPAETVRAPIVEKCGLSAERLAIERDPAMAAPGILIKGSELLTDKQLSCFGDQLAASSEAYPAFEDDDLGKRYSRIVEIDNRRRARADMRRRGLLAHLPRFDRRHESLRHFARRLEALCHAKPGSILEVRGAHIQLVEAKLTNDIEFSEGEMCSISAAIASGHNPFYVPEIKLVLPSVDFQPVVH